VEAVTGSIPETKATVINRNRCIARICIPRVLVTENDVTENDVTENDVLTQSGGIQRSLHPAIQSPPIVNPDQQYRKQNAIGQRFLDLVNLHASCSSL
jgi:hypothetical protein